MIKYAILADYDGIPDSGVYGYYATRQDAEFALARMHLPTDASIEIVEVI